MKIILAGASGRIGKHVDKALSGNHEIVRVGAHSGDMQCDYTDSESFHAMFMKIGDSDITGKVLRAWGGLPCLSD